MNIKIHCGHVLSYSEPDMILSLQDEELKEKVAIHWTSYWGTIPNLVPSPNEKVDLVYSKVTADFNLIGVRPKN